MRHVRLSALAALALAAASASTGCPAQPGQAVIQAATAAAIKRTIAPPPEAPVWGYEGADGPAAWGTLCPEWAPCGAGQAQSPIDIVPPARGDLPALETKLRPAKLKIVHHEHMADVVNTGHSIQVNYSDGDTLTIGDERFALLQYHFHSPSEHTVGGKHFAMEMHLVHRSSKGNLAVIGVFIEEGKANAAFDPIWANLPTSKGVEHHLEHVEVDVDRLLPADRTTYRYVGSLTTPPCSEGVRWVVMTTPVQLSAEQIGAFRKILVGNNRPVQPLHGRALATDRVK